MRTIRTARRLCVPAAVLAASLVQVTPALAAPPSNGCPNGYDLMEVAPLTAQGYQVPAQVDDPNSGVKSFGKPGNGDGWVCGVPSGNRTTPWGGQVYNFWDNTLHS